MELIKGQKYWCGWASRYARYIRTLNKYNCITGKHEMIHQFRDIGGAIIECEDSKVSKWIKDIDGAN